MNNQIKSNQYQYQYQYQLSVNLMQNALMHYA